MKFGKPDDPTALHSDELGPDAGNSSIAKSNLTLKFYGRPACSSCARELYKFSGPFSLKQETSAQELAQAVCAACKKRGVKQPAPGTRYASATPGNDAFEHYSEWADWEAMGGERSKAGLGKHDPRELPGLPRMHRAFR
jgi:hypothetical protein